MSIKDRINKIDNRIAKIEEDVSLLISVSSSISKALKQILKSNIIKEETNKELFDSLYMLISNLSLFFKDISDFMNNGDNIDEDDIYENDNKKDKITVH